MAKVSAAILIYDIRGFTAASKQLPAAELGRFATAAHRSILELFAEQPPTFVKNLGDGHMLIWETDEKPDPQLIKFIVAAGTKARAVFPAFVAGHLQDPENVGQKLPTQVGIGVVVGEVSKSDDYYGRDVNLAARLQNDCRPEGLAMNQATYDLAVNEDMVFKKTFRRGKVRLKGLGKTVMWVSRPFSWERLWDKYWLRVSVGFTVIGLPLLYMFLADLNSDLLQWQPGGDYIRDTLDSSGWTVMRRGQLDAEVRRVADGDRRAIADALLKARVAHGLIAVDLRDFKASESDMWGTSQAITGLLKMPHLELAKKRELLDVFDYAFSKEMFIEGFGWLAHAGGAYTESEPAMWTISALACALGTPDLLEGERRKTFEDYLARAQAVVAVYRPQDTGAWNIFPKQKDPTYHSPYSTTLALLALLETRGANLPWEGSIEKRDALLKSTALYLLSQIEERKVEDGQTEWGWRRTAERASPISEGLTLQIYAELLRAEAEAGIALPPDFITHIAERITKLDRRTKDATYDMGEFTVRFTNHENREELRSEGINFLWHPWGIEAASRWLARTAKNPVPPAERVRVRRALGYLVVDQSKSKREEAINGMSFVAGEALYGLAAIPLPEAAPAKK
jgi:class 3 adenylate cyclase